MARKQVPPSLSAAAASGDRRATLQALRDVLAATILDAEPPARAALAKQLRDTMTALDVLDAGREVSASDDLAKRRQARLRGAGTEVAAPPVGGG